MNRITRWNRPYTPISPTMEGGRIKAKTFKAKTLAIEVWPAKRITFYMAT